ncbi:DUF5005 domain-containing protein [Nonomuraea jabiensis]|uniref:DUF5005 domain-containing protein n=1 Tax=Nonomuraea jabiensis TaxID=882448 RepID=UPI0034131EEF
MRKSHALTAALAALLIVLSGTTPVSYAQTLSAEAFAGAEQTDGESLHLADLAIDVGQDGRTVTVKVTALVPVPAASLLVSAVKDDQATELGAPGLGNLAKGTSAERKVELASRVQGDLGIVAVLSSRGQAADSAYLAVRGGDYGVVTAAGLQALPEAELLRARELGRLTEEEYRAKALPLHTAPGFDPDAIKVEPLAPANRSAAAAAGVTISGRITYRDLWYVQRGVRNALLELVQTDGPQTFELGRTTDSGDFTGTIGEFPAGQYVLKVSTDNQVGTIDWGTLRPYYINSGTHTWSPGNAYSGVNIDITANDDTRRAFALLDALRTVGLYYQKIRRSTWHDQLRVRYPASGSQSYNGLIEMAGSSVVCSTNPTVYCEEDAFDWTVLAHESGHVVAAEGGFASSPGGDHDICDHAWVGGRSKQDANALAFSEGWATFYGLRALQDEGVPAGIPNYTPTIYIDTPLVPPNSAGDLFYYDIETASAAPPGAGARVCSPEGEDSEMEVQRVLWDLYDSQVDSNSGENAVWGSMTDVLNVMVSATPSSLSAAYQGLSSGRSWAQRKEGQKVLSAHGIAPELTVAKNFPPTISWNNAPGGPPAHRNNNFEVQYVDGSSGTVIKSVAVGGALSYQPLPSDWNAIVSGRSSLAVQVAARQTSSPTTGPYLSAAAVLPVTPINVTSATSWDNLWQNYGDKSGDWNGGDGAQSTRLPDGSTAWFFNDSFWGEIGADGMRPLFLNSKPRNMAVVQQGTGSTLKSFGGPVDPYLNPRNHPGTLVASPPPFDNQARYHIFGGDGIMSGNTLYKFYVVMDGQSPSGNAGFPDWPVGSALATFTWDGSKLSHSAAQILGVPWTNVQWGIAVLDEGGYTYIYGDEDIASPPTKYLHLARVPQGAITDWSKWEYYTGTSWSNQASASARMMAGVSNGFSVAKINGKFVLLTTDTSAGATTWSAVAYYADQPWEFSSTTPKNVLFAPQLPFGRVQYEYRIHPQFSNGSRVLVGYTPNTLRIDNACMGENDYDARVYRPRFLNVVLPGLSGSSGALPTTGAPAPTAYPNTPPVPPSQMTWHTVDDSYGTSKCGSTPASAPSPALTATPTPDTGVALQWTMSPVGMWIYNVQYHDDTADPNWNNPPASDPNCKTAASQGGWCTMPYPISGTRSFTMENLVAYHNYRFRVAAGPWRSGGSTWSNTATATPVIPPPTTAPTNVKATAGRGSVTITWTDNTPDVWFRVVRKEGSTVLKTESFPAKTMTWYTSVDGDPEHPRQYEFWVVENNLGGDGPASAHVTATPLPCGLWVGIACDQP